MTLLLILFLLCSIADTTPQPHSTELPPSPCGLVPRIKEFRKKIYGIPEELFNMERLIKFSDEIPVENRTDVNKEVISLRKLRFNNLRNDLFEYTDVLSNLETILRSFNDDIGLPVGEENCAENDAESREIDGLKRKLEQLENDNREQKVAFEELQTELIEIKSDSSIRSAIMTSLGQEVEQVKSENIIMKLAMNQEISDNKENVERLEQETSENQGNIERVEQELNQLKLDNNQTIEELQSDISRQIDENQMQSESDIAEQIDTVKQDLGKKFPDLGCKWFNGTWTSGWHLGMNLNPADGHIMDYTTGWADDVSIGSDINAFSRDYLNQRVWNEPANYIAIARHQSGIVDAVKVFKFTTGGLSLLQRFDSNNLVYYRARVTSGGPIQETISPRAPYMTDDPVFSVGGDLVFNWGYSNNGARIALTGGYLAAADVNDDNTHGLGGHFGCNPQTGVSRGDIYKYEVDVICPGSSACWKIQGTDHGSYGGYKSGPVYGNYAIYVSQDATTFPEPGHILDLEIDQCG